MDIQARFERAAHQLTCRLVGSHELTGGSSAEVHALDLVTADGEARRVVFRQHQLHKYKGQTSTVTPKEFATMRALHALGFAVAEPYLVNADEGWLVTSWVEGSSDLALPELTSALDQMADFLLALHRCNVDELQIELLEPLEDPIEALPRYLPSTPQGNALGDILGRGQLDLALNEPVLVHGDYWPGNLLWLDGTLAAVIDWEDATRGDPLADLACARVELLCQFGADAMDHFTERYLASASGLDVTSLPVWEVYVSAAALATMHLWAIEPDDEAARRATTNEFFNQAAALLTSP